MMWSYRHDRVTLMMMMALLVSLSGATIAFPLGQQSAISKVYPSVIQQQQQQQQQHLSSLLDHGNHIVDTSLDKIHSKYNHIISLRAGGSGTSDDDSTSKPITEKVGTFLNKNFFLVGMFIAVILAKQFPSLGVNKGVLRPELFIGKYGVGLIFLLSGLSLQASELTKAVSNVKLNSMIQIAIFGLWPWLVGVPLQGLFTNVFPNLIPPALVQGLLILTCLPTTVNMCIMLTSAGGGNTATSICNAVISNMAGIFVTPALLFHFFGANIQLPFLKMVLKLCKKVLLPVAIGQALRATPVKTIVSKRSKFFKRLQEVILLGIVWNAFCNAFTEGLGLDLNHSIILLILLPIIHLSSLGGLFKLFSLKPFNFTKSEIVAAMFCSSQKTLAFGLPLINTVFEGNANLAAYCAPLMFIHPLQMTIGSILLPMINNYTAKEDE